ncbi:MAG: hypothetical protein CMN44_02310 [SAR116 cluster bacterium]|nr:hypothetical protein [SAR116 cluster bacterium]RPH11371.1 MAG: hypothetical protein CBC14_002285 [Alphaproteobacteria bacterium TMED54]
MYLTQKLSETTDLINILENNVKNQSEIETLKATVKHISNDLQKYKQLDIINDKSEIENNKDSLKALLLEIKNLEKSLNRKLLITQKYNHFLNS